MKRFLYCSILAILFLGACTQAPKETATLNRAQMILNEIYNPASDYVVVISHRGDSQLSENSIPAIESVIRMGVDMVELDVMLRLIVFWYYATIGRSTAP